MATRNHCSFGPEPPRFTPADRFEALCEVAEKARLVVPLARLVARREFDQIVQTARLEEAHRSLDLALDRLGEIETYLGVQGSAS